MKSIEDRLESAIQRWVQREDRDEGRSPEGGAGADRRHEQPAPPRRPFGGAGAREMAYADPAAEQADRTRNEHQDKMVNRGLGRHADIRL